MNRRVAVLLSDKAGKLAINLIKKSYKFIGFFKVKNIIPFHSLYNERGYSIKIPRISLEGNYYYDGMEITEQKSLSMVYGRVPNDNILRSKRNCRKYTLVDISEILDKYTAPLQRSVDSNKYFMNRIDMFYTYYRREYGILREKVYKREKYFKVKRSHI